MQLEREEKLEAKLEQYRQESAHQRRHFEAKLEEQRRESEQQRRQFEAKLDEQRRESEQQRRQFEAKLEEQRQKIELGDQLTALQPRLQSLHAAKLLTEDELFVLEDIVVDCIEALPTVGASALEEKARAMLLVSSKVANDSLLARQLRRKFGVKSDT